MNTPSPNNNISFDGSDVNSPIVSQSSRAQNNDRNRAMNTYSSQIRKSLSFRDSFERDDEDNYYNRGDSQEIVEEVDEEEEINDERVESGYNNNNKNNYQRQVTINSTNYDRDDSLYDALSIGKQTPFRLDYVNFDNEQEKINQYNISNNNNNNIINNENQLGENFAFNYAINRKYENKSNLTASQQEDNRFSPANKSNDLMADMKDSSIDEILLIAGGDTSLPNDTKNRTMNTSILNQTTPNNNNNKSILNTSRQSKIPIPNRSLSRPVLNHDNNASKLLHSSSFHHLSNQFLNSNESFKNELFYPNKNNNDNSLIELMKTPQPELVVDSDDLLDNNNNDKNKNTAKKNKSTDGAFKLYAAENSDLNFSDNNNVINKNNSTINNTNNNNNSKTVINRISPFVSIDKVNEKSTVNKKSSISTTNLNNKRGAIKKYRSGSTSFLNEGNRRISTIKEKHSNTEKIKSNIGNSMDRLRPSTTNIQTIEMTYSLDSDESTIIDNLINNPDELRQKLKQSKLEREQLNQLQANYLKLLEQYAEAENFIDTFRLGNKVSQPNTPSANMFQGLLVSQNQKEGLRNDEQIGSSLINLNRELFENRFGVQSAISERSNSTVNLNGSINSLNRTPTNQFNSNNNNDILPNVGGGVFVITSSNNRQSVIPFSTELVDDNASNSSGHSSRKAGNNLISSNKSTKSNIQLNKEEIILDQSSKLGIIVQTKVLEDKMQSFITLIDEKQLNKVEQRQVYDNIKSDYENLLKNYEEAKRNDANGILPGELDMDIDLNKELDKMKGLLNDIVDKMCNNLIITSPSPSIISKDRKSSGDSSTLSSYANHEEIINQYNRLLDVFNNETSLREKDILELTNNSDIKEPNQNESKHINNQQNLPINENQPQPLNTSLNSSKNKKSQVKQNTNITNNNINNNNYNNQSNENNQLDKDKVVNLTPIQTDANKPPKQENGTKTRKINKKTNEVSDATTGSSQKTMNSHNYTKQSNDEQLKRHLTEIKYNNNNNNNLNNNNNGNNRKKHPEEPIYEQKQQNQNHHQQQQQIRQQQQQQQKPSNNKNHFKKDFQDVYDQKRRNTPDERFRRTPQSNQTENIDRIINENVDFYQDKSIDDSSSNYNTNNNPNYDEVTNSKDLDILNTDNVYTEDKDATSYYENFSNNFDRFKHPNQFINNGSKSQSRTVEQIDNDRTLTHSSSFDSYLIEQKTDDVPDNYVIQNVIASELTQNEFLKKLKSKNNTHINSESSSSLIRKNSRPIAPSSHGNKNIPNLKNQNPHQHECNHNCGCRKNVKKQDSQHNLRNLPVARAYEGSDSNEDLDSINIESYSHDNAIVNNYDYREHVDNRRNPKIIVHNNEKENYKLVKDKRQIKPNERVVHQERVYEENYYSSNSPEESTETSTDVPVRAIHKKHSSSTKMLKSETMKKLSDEIETLKQKIIQKQLLKIKKRSMNNGMSDSISCVDLWMESNQKSYKDNRREPFGVQNLTDDSALTFDPDLEFLKKNRLRRTYETKVRSSQSLSTKNTYKPAQQIVYNVAYNSNHSNTKSLENIHRVTTINQTYNNQKAPNHEKYKKEIFYSNSQPNFNGDNRIRTKQNSANIDHNSRNKIIYQIPITNEHYYVGSQPNVNEVVYCDQTGMVISNDNQIPTVITTKPPQVPIEMNRVNHQNDLIQQQKIYSVPVIDLPVNGYPVNGHYTQKVIPKNAAIIVNGIDEKIQYKNNGRPTLMQDSHQQRGRKVRYYIREYGDISTASDNEITNRRKTDSSEQRSASKTDEKNSTVEKFKDSKSILLLDMFDLALRYAFSLNSKSFRIKRKIRDKFGY